MLDTKVIKDKQDLTNLSWSKIKNTSGISGSYLKSYSYVNGKKIYYKLSNYDYIHGVIGIENINEIIVDRLLTLLGIEHLHYQLIKADIKVNEKIIETYVCVSEDFKQSNEDKIALDNYYFVEHQEGEDILSFCTNHGFEEYIYEMIVVDFIILNRDRHGANIEVLRDRKKQTIRIAPLFDHGLSLLFNCRDDKQVESFDIMEDKLVNNYIGSRSVKENLKLIDKNKMPKINKLQISDKEYIFKDLDNIISNKMIDKIWDMIYKRWCYYENTCY